MVEAQRPGQAAFVLPGMAKIARELAAPTRLNVNDIIEDVIVAASELSLEMTLEPGSYVFFEV